MTGKTIADFNSEHESRVKTKKMIQLVNQAKINEDNYASKAAELEVCKKFNSQAINKLENLLEKEHSRRIQLENENKILKEKNEPDESLNEKCYDLGNERRIHKLQEQKSREFERIYEEQNKALDIRCKKYA